MLLAAQLPVTCAEAPAPLTRTFSGTPDPAASNGEATTRDKVGIYCWWVTPRIRPGYFEIIARARTKAAAGVLHFVLTDNKDETRVHHAITKTRRGSVKSGEYQEIYCGTFYWDGSYSPRVSDWSSAGLMLDWVKLVRVTAADVRDPLPGVLKRYEAPRFDATPTIDGDLAEWTRVPALTLDEDSARSANYRGTADCSATGKFAWDAAHLYFACEVTDDSLTVLDDAKALSRLWQFDGVQLALDAAGDAKTPGYDVNDYEYGFGQTAAGPMAYRWVAGNNLPVGDVPTIDVAVTRDEGARVTRYEVAMPFKEVLPLSPERPQCGMTFVVNDNDGGPRAWLEWTPGIAGSKDPSAFGELRLIDAPPSATDISALVVAERDLSGKQDATMHVRVRSPRDVGDCVFRWRVQRTDAGTEPVLQGKQALENVGTETALPIRIDLAKLGQGRFGLTAELRRGDDVLVSTNARFFRFALDRLNARLVGVKERLASGLERIAKVRDGGGHAHYPRATLGAVDEFARYTEGDLKKAKYERAESTFGDLEQLLDEAEAEIKAIETDPGGDIDVPRLPAARVEARNGGFYCGDEPVLLLGYCGWWQVWSMWRRLADEGLNHLQDSIIAPFALFPDSGEKPDEKLMQGLRWAWQRGDQSGICYSRMIACNQVHQSFRDKHAGATGGGWSGMCTLHPQVRELQNRYLTTIAKTAGAYGSAGVYVLYGENSHALTDHPLEVAAFAENLKQQYGTLGALNDAWGTTFAEWGDVGSARNVESPVAWHDRGRFSQRLFAEWSGWLQEQVRSADPRALCTGYPSLLSWDDSSDFSSGIDMEALCRTFNVNGFDTAGLDYGGKRWAMSSITGFAMPHDLVKAFNPQNPNFDPELHLVNVNVRYPDEYIRAAMFQGCLHGMSAASLWVFQRNEGMDSMLVFQPRVMASYIRACLDLRRLTKPVLAFQQAPSDAAILYSLTSIAYNADHLTELRAVYAATFFSDIKVSFLTERTIGEGALAKTKLLIVPSASHLPEPVAQAVAGWANDGGRAVLIGDCFLRDQRNRELPELLDGIAGVVRTERTGDPARYRDSLDPIIEKAIHRPFRAVDDGGKPLDGVEMRTVKTDRGRLFYAINMNKSPVSFDLAPRPRGKMLELRTCRTVELPRRMDSLEVMVLRTQ